MEFLGAGEVERFDAGVAEGDLLDIVVIMMVNLLTGKGLSKEMKQFKLAICGGREKNPAETHPPGSMIISSLIFKERDCRGLNSALFDVRIAASTGFLRSKSTVQFAGLFCLP